MKRLLCLSLVLLTFAGCTARRSSASFYYAIAPEYSAYVQQDQSLTQDQKDRRHRTLEAWKATIAVEESR
jgi:hypothetical protein